jgi:cysteinyl-tRNA synthetase
MASCLLGDCFDIHGGGRDLVFPHHENEIAQSEAKSGGTYARYWVHNGLLTVNRQKMSKSMNNFITIEDAIRDYGYELIRLSIYQVHYQSNVDFSPAGFLAGLKRLYAWYRTRHKVKEIRKSFSGAADTVLAENHRKKFVEAMDDDFNLPRALAAIQGILQEQNEILKRNRAAEVASLMGLDDLLDEVLPLLEVGCRSPEEYFSDVHNRYLRQINLKPEDIHVAIQSRMKARSDRNFAEADRIRNSLMDMGVQVVDLGEQTRWELTDQALEKLLPNL